MIRSYSALSQTFRDLPWSVLESEQKRKHPVAQYHKFCELWFRITYYRSLCITEKSHIGLGLRFIRRGLSVVLVKRRSVFYVLERVEDSIKRRISKRNKLWRTTPAQEQEQDLLNQQGTLPDLDGRNGAYISYGEAYVDGFMDGDLESSAHFDRLSLV